MSIKKLAGWLGFAVCTSGLVAGCDLIEFAKNPSVSLTLPKRSYSFSTSDPRWKAPPPTFNQAVTCSAMSDCCKIPMGGATFECSQFPLSCDSSVCAMKIDLEVPQTIDLKRDAPEFADVGGRVVEEVLLKELRYTADNQLGVDLPPVDVFVAPAGVNSSAGNDQVKLLVSLPMIMAGQKPDQEVVVPLSAEAQKAFSERALNFDSPFNLIAGTDVLVRSGTPVPMGKVDITVTGKVTVKF
jgi:hypothetical protein